jgi:hypothetical protein
MTRTSSPSAAYATIPFKVSAALFLALTGIVPVAHALGSFGRVDLVKQVFCDMSAIKGQLSGAESRYTGSGSCLELQSPQRSDQATNTSEFPDTNKGIELFRANWSSQGTYNPVSKETWEKVTMPAPAIDEKSPVGRPYGNYETRMICATDPWLTGGSVECTGKTVKATGNLGDLEAALRKLDRPLTTPTKDGQLQALVAAHERQGRILAPVAKLESTESAGAVALAPRPSIVEPRQGGMYPPQTPLRVRIVPAKNAKDTAYRIEIQVQSNFDWRDVATVSTPADVAHSLQGYRDWGGQPNAAVTQMTAIAGIYRLRARGSAPRLGQPSDWVEFKIDGQPGREIDAVNRATSVPLNGGSGAAAQSATSRPPATQPTTGKVLGSTPAASVKNDPNATLLNPQPLPPKAAPAALTATPQDPARNNAGAGLLNTQPLQSKTLPAASTPVPLDAARTKAGPVLLNPQLLPPNGSPQAPSSLR